MSDLVHAVSQISSYGQPLNYGSDYHERKNTVLNIFREVNDRERERRQARSKCPSCRPSVLQRAAEHAEDCLQAPCLGQRQRPCTPAIMVLSQRQRDEL
ncbi:uncharacterized [Tachysurus ichikawai]